MRADVLTNVTPMLGMLGTAMLGCPIYPHCNGPFIDHTVRTVGTVRFDRPLDRVYGP